MGEPARTSDTVAHVWETLRAVPDPEIPVISIVNLGIVRDVREAGGHIEVDLTPTYSGCPATDLISFEVLTALARAGFADAKINTVLSPPWTTDWIDEEGRARLLDYGIAPPAKARRIRQSLLGEEPAIACPRCGSSETMIVSPFGSTPCKAHYKCRACLEPFDYFKCL